MNYEQVSESEVFHIPVLVKEVMHYLNLKKGHIVFDGTLGGAGHTIEITKAIAPTGKVIAVDLDSQAISTATSKLEKLGLLKYVYIINDNFANVVNILKELGIKKINGFLLDLGLSSIQIEKSERGFSYLKNEKLDMRFNTLQQLSAYNVINEYTEEKLREIFYKYGEEKWAPKIARNIIEHRKKGVIKYTGDLVEIIKDSIPKRYSFKKFGHPAKKVFQAIRIEVNKELENLEKAVNEGIKIMDSKARMVIISYHSLEDRIVKKSFEIYSGKCVCPKGLPICSCGAKKIGNVLTKKVVRPSYNEIEKNPRAKSAKLRAFEKL